MRPAWTMAESRPACAHSCRNTELMTWRAAGLRPKEMFDRPSVVWTPGRCSLMSRMPSMVAAPSPRDSSMPVPSVRASGSKMRSLGLEAVALDGDVVDLLGRPELPLGRAGLALLVDAGAHDGGAVLLGQGQEAVEAGAGGVAVLEVDRVEDGPAAEVLERGLDRRRPRSSRSSAARWTGWRTGWRSRPCRRCRRGRRSRRRRR